MINEDVVELEHEPAQAGLDLARHRWRGRTRLRLITPLTEILIDKIVIYPHPHVMDAAGNRHYTTRAIPYQDPEMEAEWLKAVHEARGRDRPRL